MPNNSYSNRTKEQREADIEAIRRWMSDLELPFGTNLATWHTFGVDLIEYLQGEPLVKE
jgi:hypothetical protein